MGKRWCQVDSQRCQVVFFAKDLNTDRDLQLSQNCSDRRGVLYLFNDFPKNPGATKMLGKDELEKMARSNEEKTGSNEEKTRSKERETRPKAQEGVNAVLLQDILSSISSTTVVLKMDIEGYECKVPALLW